MELISMQQERPTLDFTLLTDQVDVDQEALVFLEANTLAVGVDDLNETCTIPVFAKDNETTISHNEFIMSVYQAVKQIYPCLQPKVRVSHPVKGRIPEARHKKAVDLLPHEETLYYERMMFAIEIPSVKQQVGDDLLTLTIGGVRSYHLENLHSKKSQQRFKLFVGFKNRVCCNLCVWSDGYVEDLKALETYEIANCIRELVIKFKPEAMLEEFARWKDLKMSEQQFAEFVGRCRMYLYMPKSSKVGLPSLDYGDSQINKVVEGYYHDPAFPRDKDGSITLWNLYNLFTGANKSSYIDRFLDRGVNAADLVRNLSFAL